MMGGSVGKLPFIGKYGLSGLSSLSLIKAYVPPAGKIMEDVVSMSIITPESYSGSDTFGLNASDSVSIVIE